MKKLLLGRPSPAAVVVLTVIALVAAGGAAWAAIPGDDATVTACVSKDGTLKVIDADAGKTCQGSQTTVKLASTDPTGKVANADALDGHDSTAFLFATGKAADADNLDGKDSTNFLEATGKAADADRLDGLDSSTFVTSATPASGDLVGLYPAPRIGTNVVAAPQLDVLPLAQARTGSGSSVPGTETFTDVAMDFEDYDTTGTMHDSVANTHKFVAPVRGCYAIAIQVRWFGGTIVEGGYRSIRTTAGLIQSTQPMVQNVNVQDIQSASGVMCMGAGESVGLQAATTTGSYVEGMMSMRFISAACPPPPASQACASTAE